ncbi:MAG: homoserine dehydrogenase, partial [Paracoccaceae bacterium]|nr:homoserine dehydrogenase [Paracoccaceae bacterium]
GTCNYILTRMENAGLPYDEVFKEADALGFLEADPNLDVGGIDAGHKLSLLSSIAFGTQVDFNGVKLEGIQRIKIEDIHQAAQMGYRIKLLGTARMSDKGLEQSMAPCLVPAQSPLGQLEGGTNMVVVEGDSVGQIVLRGAGAGEGPTASAVMGDICDIARGLRVTTFGQPAATLVQANSVESSSCTPYYLRVDLLDKPGALAALTSALGTASVSIDRMRQSQHDEGIAPVLIVTHACTWEALSRALNSLPETGFVEGQPVALRIEDV